MTAPSPQASAARHVSATPRQLVVRNEAVDPTMDAMKTPDRGPVMDGTFGQADLHQVRQSEDEVLRASQPDELGV
jgi:hypothetical protein